VRILKSVVCLRQVVFMSPCDVTGDIPEKIHTHGLHSLLQPLECQEAQERRPWPPSPSLPQKIKEEMQMIFFVDCCAFLQVIECKCCSVIETPSEPHKRRSIGDNGKPAT